MRVKRARQDNSAHSKIEISMRAWNLCVRTALSGVFVVIPEISHSDISQMIKKRRAAFFLYGFRVAFLCPFVFL